MIDRGYPLHPYYKEMPGIGAPLARTLKQNVADLKAQEELIAQEVDRVKNNGKATELMNEKGEWTAWQRLDYLVDPGTWCPVHTIYDPLENAEGNTGVIEGLGKIAGRWAIIIASNNKVVAGAWP
jgi:glutaconyl-CoA decarboxylase